MSAMIDAIKKRRMGGHESQAPGHMSKRGPGVDLPGEGETDLHGLVAGLSDHEKTSLQQILAKDNGVSAIEKGGASSEERGHIAEQMKKDDAMHAAEESEEHAEGIDSDAIAKSMLDSRDMGSNPITEPRNLGERMRMSVSNKLKAKGKI